MAQNKVLIIGLGASGRAAARFLLNRGAQVWGTDQNRDHLQNHAEIAQLKMTGLHALHESEALDISTFDLVVVSPGVPPKNPIYILAKQAGKEIIGEIELACRYI
jgi:UDP-N-acetylmuramoylalanine--D-glutamate ligase